MNENYITASCVISNHTVHKNGQVFFADNKEEVTGFLTLLYKYLDTGYARFYKMDTLAKLGWLASEVLLKDSFQREQYEPEETGIVLANANASLDTDIKYQATIQDIPSPSVFVYTLPNIVTGEICIRNHIKGENAFFISEQFDAVFIQEYVSNLLNNGILRACICGWVELVGNEYKAALYLVEKNAARGAERFNSQNMYSLFEGEKIK